jgi:hypothetical protein
MNARPTLQAPVPSAPLAPGLGVSMGAIGRILGGAWHRRVNQRDGWVVAAAAVGGVVLVFALLSAVGAMAAAEAVFGFLLLMAFLAWCDVVGSVFEQNRPIAARLVPGHVQHLRLALIGGSLVAIALAVLLLGGLLASVAGSDRPHPLPPVTPTVLLAIASFAAVVTAGIGLFVRWPTFGYLGFIGPVFVLTGSDFGLVSFYHVVAAAWSVAPATATGLAVVAQALVLSALVQAGGAAHAMRYARRQQVRERFRRRALGLTPDVATERSLGGVGGWKRAGYRAWFARGVARPTSVMSRVFLALGPTAHWTTMFIGIGSVVFVMGMMFFGMWMLGRHELARAMVSGLPFGAPMMACIPLIQVCSRFNPTRREQALLVLLPGVPRGATLNRGLAGRLTAEFLGAWAVGVAVALLLQHALGPQGGMSNEMPLLAAAATLPMVTGLWRRIDLTKAPSQAGIFGKLLALGGLVAAALGLRWALHWSDASIAVLYVVPTVAWCAWRWVRLGRAPTAFPVGR